MSWHFSRVLVAEYSEANCSGGVPFVPLNTPSTPHLCSSSDKMIEFCRRSPYGMMCEPLTEDLGAELLTWFRAGFPAKPTAPRLAAKSRQKTFGRKCDESWQMSLPHTSLPRTPKEEQSIKRQTALKRWVTKPAQLPLPRLTWVLTTFGSGTGYLHTPTATANYAAKSMQKHECCRNFVAVFGRPTPLNQEWLMGWPPNWTALEPLATDKYQQWLHSHGRF